MRASSEKQSAADDGTYVDEVGVGLSSWDTFGCNCDVPLGHAPGGRVWDPPLDQSHTKSLWVIHMRMYLRVL